MIRILVSDSATESTATKESSISISSNNNNNNRRKTQSLTRSHQNNTHKMILFRILYIFLAVFNGKFMYGIVYIYLFYLSFVPLDSRNGFELVFVSVLYACVAFACSFAYFRL